MTNTHSTAFSPSWRLLLLLATSLAACASGSGAQEGTKKAQNDSTTQQNGAPHEMASKAMDTPTEGASGLYLIDVLTLNSGVEVAQAQEYFDRVDTVIRRHGLENVYRFRVEKRLAGSIEAQVINIWSMSGSDTMPGIQKDPEYQANVKFRNATFNMPKTEMFMAEAKLAPTPSDAELLFIDMLPLQPGVAESQADEYFTKVGEVVERHGLVPLARFRITKKLSGSSEPNLVNLWTMAGPKTMPGIQGDSAYQKNVPFRNATFDMSSISMFTLRPSGSM